jgi:hypothetical protein
MLRERGDREMDSLFTGSVQSWIGVAAATLGPLIALIVGFEGADWFLRRGSVSARGRRRG